MTTIYMNNNSPSNFPFVELEDQRHHMISTQHEQIAASSSLSSPPMFFSFTTTQDHRAGGDHPSTHFHQNQQKVIDILHGERSMKWKCSKEEKEKEENYRSGSNDCSVRVCTDCSTTKTPLWRSGPRGPKSLCNACGIRQRKAKRAAMALASDASMSPKSPKKEKKMRTSYVAKHKKKKKLSFEEFALGLISKNSGFRQVFPQDEEEAAILLMALSCGLSNS